MIKNRLGALAALPALLTAAPALAHHPMGGATPASFMQGFLSGVGHPVIGFDHLAFIILVGVAAVYAGARYVGPLGFVVATMAGCLIHVAGFMLPGAEWVIAGSVALLGGLMLSGVALPRIAALALFAFAGLFHGWAYGAAIIGAETTPLVAYLAAFGATQFLIAVAAGFAVASLMKAASAKALEPRLAGAVCAGIGLTFLLEMAESAVFG